MEKIEKTKSTLKFCPPLYRKVIEQVRKTRMLKKKKIAVHLCRTIESSELLFR